MKAFRLRDTDGGNNTIIIADDIKTAIDLFVKRYAYNPETIVDLTADGEFLIIQGIDLEVSF